MDNKDQEIIDKLKQLPKIKDSQDKNLLFQKIDQKMKGVKPVKKTRHAKWIVPSIATLAIAALVFIMVQTGIFDQDQLSNHSSDLETKTFDMDDSDSEEALEFSVDEEEFNLEEDAEETADSEDESEVIINEIEDYSDQLIYYSDEDDSVMYTIGVMDMQAMYAIPISIVDMSETGAGSPNDIYNRISTLIDDEAFGVYEYPFDEIEFIFSDDQENITMRVADDYVFPDTSAQIHSFISIINLMFEDYPASELNLETDTTNSIDLGQIGVMEELELEPVTHLAYKLYQFEDKERLLIPIPHTISGEEFFTIDEALLEMQYDQIDFDITASIPVGIEYTVDPSDEDVLKLTFESDSIISDNRETKEMIEAILMTAKSLDFKQVEFDFDGDVTQIDQFNLLEPIPVPEGANPVLLDEA